MLMLTSKIQYISNWLAYPLWWKVQENQEIHIIIGWVSELAFNVTSAMFQSYRKSYINNAYN